MKILQGNKNMNFRMKPKNILEGNPARKSRRKPKYKSWKDSKIKLQKETKNFGRKTKYKCWKKTKYFGKRARNS